MLKKYSLILLLIISCIFSLSCYCLKSTTTLTSFAEEQFSITVNCSSGGAVNYEGNKVEKAISILKDSNATFYFVSDNAYELQSVTIDGIKQLSPSYSYSFINLNKNHTIEVSFSPIAVNILILTDGNGSINAVRYDGSFVTYEIKPFNGYEIASVKLNGEELGIVDEYTFNDLKASHSLSAQFKLKEFNIVLNIFNGKAESDLSLQNVKFGENRTIKITPDDNYLVKRVTVNGESYKLSNGDLILNNISNNLNINIECAKKKIGFTNLNTSWLIALLILIAILIISIIILVIALIRYKHNNDNLSSSVDLMNTSFYR